MKSRRSTPFQVLLAQRSDFDNGNPRRCKSALAPPFEEPPMADDAAHEPRRILVDKPSSV
jgi:hypothetical protein